jgi:hypothetical protein
MTTAPPLVAAALGLRDDVAALVPRVQALVRHEIAQIYVLRRGPPDYAAQLSTDVAIHHVLSQAQATLERMGAPASVLLATAPSEVAFYWTRLMRDNYELNVLRTPPKVMDMTFELIRGLSSGVFHNFRQGKRYRAYLESGPPPGVQQFPEYTRGEKVKSEEVPFAWHTPGYAPGRFQRYMSQRAGLPQRKQSLRSSTCVDHNYERPTIWA